MPPSTHLTTIAREIAHLRAELARLLDTGSNEPRSWAETAPELDRLAGELLWCRDAALVVARRGAPGHGTVPWTVLETLTGVPDSTLSDRFTAFTDPAGGPR